MARPRPEEPPVTRATLRERLPMLEGGEEACEWPLVLMMGGMCWLEGDLAAETVRFEASESQIGRDAGVNYMGSSIGRTWRRTRTQSGVEDMERRDQNQEDKA